ncbi:MAG: acetate/propionate family kinase [Filomicrobium sp.]
MVERKLLTLNAGSSSVKFAVYGLAREPVTQVSGQVENLGPAARLSVKPVGGEKFTRQLGSADHAEALKEIIAEAVGTNDRGSFAGFGHRIAHGGSDFTSPTAIDDDVVQELRKLEPLAPLHQPHNLACVEAARRLFPDALQLACFDTAFHRGHPWVNDTFALPKAYFERGIRRYGFHGLSYDFITSELARTAPDVANGRVIIAHLGNGASMCAVRDGRSVASTMGFSALDGLPMGTRCGQLDPGVLLYLLEQEQMTPADITRLLYRESGLKGLSGLTHDMRELEASDDEDARKAIEYFVFRVRREIGAMCAVLGGVDALVFCGGIGENSATIRQRICEQMEWIGISVDAAANAQNATRIESGQVAIFVIQTDEERVIARALAEALAPDS